MWWLLTAVVCTIVGFFLAALLAFVFSNYGDDKGRFAVVSVAVMAILYAIANSMAYTKTSEHEFRVATLAEAASLYDFSSGSEYPLEIGDRSVSASGEFTIMNGGFFSVSGYGQMQAGASILVGYQHADGDREILEIPLSNVAFRIIDYSESSSIVIDFSAVSGSAPEYTAEDIPGDCHNHIRWGWWTRECATINTTVTSSTNEGVAGLLQKALASGNAGKFVVVSVTEAEYRQILGSAGSTTETETPAPSPTQR